MSAPAGSHRAQLVRVARRAMSDYGLEPDFPLAALAEAERLEPPAAVPGGDVRDLRGLPWCSIDNDDSRDLDQLTVAQELPGDRARVRVAVADVGAAVPPDGALDAHAAANTTSVYTPAWIFPMLPERLSTDLTSLNPDEDRLAVVVELEVDAEGGSGAADVRRAVVRNRAKLAYPSLGAWLEGRGPLPQAAAAVPGLAENLRLQEALRRSQIATSEFIDFVAHELKQPMTALKGYTQMLVMGIGGELKPTQRQFVDVIGANVERMSKLVNDLLEVSRLEGGRIQLKVAPVSLVEVLNDTLAGTLAQIEARAHCLEIDVPEDLSLVLGDRQRLVQALTLLVDNACRYTPQGGRLRLVGSEQEGHVCLRVVDSGIGLSLEEMRHLGEKFYRAEHELVQAQPGNGLGLSIARHLIALHGGQLLVDSEPGRGSSFAFTLPAAPHAEALLRDLVDAPLGLAGADGARVDDDVEEGRVVEERAPALPPLDDVVGEQRGRHHRLEGANGLDHRRANGRGLRHRFGAAHEGPRGGVVDGAAGRDDAAFELLDEGLERNFAALQARPGAVVAEQLAAHRLPALGVRKTEGDGQAHVRHPQLGDYRAVHKLHQRMNNALGMNHHVDIRRRQLQRRGDWSCARR